MELSKRKVGGDLTEVEEIKVFFINFSGFYIILLFSDSFCYLSFLHKILKYYKGIKNNINIMFCEPI